MTTRLFPAIAAVSLALATQAALAQAPVSEAVIDRFVASLPDVLLPKSVDRTPDPAELDRLSGLNPGRVEELRPILETYQECILVVINAKTEAAFRDFARQLGTAKVTRLTQFYQGPDFLTFRALIDRTNQGETLSDTETATLSRLMTEYPLPELYAQFKRFEDELKVDTAFVGKITKCSLAKKQALIGARLAYN